MVCKQVMGDQVDLAVVGNDSVGKDSVSTYAFVVVVAGFLFVLFWLVFLLYSVY